MWIRSVRIILVGDPEADDSQALLRCIHSHHLAARTLIFADRHNDGYLYQQLPLLSTVTKIDDKATVYVCKKFTCSAPVNSVKSLDEVLTQQAEVSQ
ncbi:hypothetical protein LSH36_529g00029 [Paralvinella palmiformis]|uniref:Thioredoxin domain-containing protein n=1 Tax=Paralvinella palmiformis TaxID=53620 RepID=A0AAD9J860_9ANNE|nr:hypothetical protein LSH36_529g00029 [Paralvinella palmiformis]